MCGFLLLLEENVEKMLFEGFEVGKYLEHSMNCKRLVQLATTCDGRDGRGALQFVVSLGALKMYFHEKVCSNRDSAIIE